MRRRFHQRQMFTSEVLKHRHVLLFFSAPGHPLSRRDESLTIALQTSRIARNVVEDSRQRAGIPGLLASVQKILGDAP